MATYRQQEKIKYVQGQINKARAYNYNAEELLKQIKKDSILLEEKIKNKEKNWLVLKNNINSNIGKTVRDASFALELAVRSCGEYDDLNTFSTNINSVSNDNIDNRSNNYDKQHHIMKYLSIVQKESNTYQQLLERVSFTSKDLEIITMFMGNRWYLDGGFGTKTSEINGYKGVRTVKLNIPIDQIELVINMTNEFIQQFLIIINGSVEDIFSTLEELKENRFNHLVDYLSESNICTILSKDNLFLQCRIHGEPGKKTYNMDLEFDYVNELYTIHCTWLNPEDDDGDHLDFIAENDAGQYKNLMRNLQNKLNDLADAGSSKYASNCGYVRRVIKEHLNKFC